VEAAMHIVHVFITVKPESIDAFRLATLDNAHNSLQEPGVARFDFLEDVEQPGRFTLVEVYRTAEDAGRHKETAHYQRWAEAVAEMMAAPRTRAVYTNVFPGEDGWG
jgi:quinol monooxygenase YgiN